MEKDLTVSGVNDFEWRKDWQELMEGKVTPAIKEEDPSLCSDGHRMVDRFHNHTLCMACGQVKWNKPL